MEAVLGGSLFDLIYQGGMMHPDFTTPPKKLGYLVQELLFDLIETVSMCVSTSENFRLTDSAMQMLR